VRLIIETLSREIYPATMIRHPDAGAPLLLPALERPLQILCAREL
jgi:hypothetical protein